MRELNEKNTSSLQPPEFYIGYAEQAPPRLARRLRQIVGGLFAGVALLALVLAWQQQRLAASRFTFQQYQDYSGVLLAQPFPRLLVTEAAPPTQSASLRSYLLVAPGKHGAELPQFDGQTVKLRGALIERGASVMLEILPASVQPLPSANRSGASAAQALGEFRLRGEIVDSKCYLGVMNPGHTKPHRECAALCIRGGIPPLLVARDEQGNELQLLLTDPQGAPLNQAVLDFVAEPVAITGQVWREGSLLYLRAAPSAIQRLP